MKIISSKISDFYKTWTQPWGQNKIVRDNHKHLLVELQEKSGDKRKLPIEYKLYNDGLSFRYISPQQNGITSINIMDEKTKFSFANNHKTLYIPAYHKQKHELLYKDTTINQLDTDHTPLTIKTTDVLYLSIHDASLVNYSSMTLYGNRKNTLKCDLVP